MSWRADVLTLFPAIFPGPLGESLAGTALKTGIWSLKTTDIREFGLGKHRSVDDTPFGGGAGVVRVFEEGGGKAFLVGAGCGAHDAGEQADGGVQQGQSGDFAAGEDIVADADFLGVAGFDDALVDAFEAATEEDDAGAGGEFLHAFLGERLAARGQHDEGSLRAGD